ncbi:MULTISPECIES: gluconokinase [Vagococcus]|uniref:Gluconokinase n=1 Tax=Vagococcus fluvialis bH819 TaxID=1255619 RepID=A0A1X6WK88_9ENTE|nr:MULTISPECIES: gluconokinase [Vagococcus]SLM84652.1 Gluconokinase [Vagococcus fluvialis bH819]HCM89884.1 gluconokinase [Vagococcus sp.]
MYRLAIDVGTTNIKLSLFEKYQLIDKIEIRIETQYKEFGKVFQNPAEILQHIKSGIKKFGEKGIEIEQISFSTAMHSIMPVIDTLYDEEMFIWLDTQASSFVKEFKKEELANRFYQKTGTPIHEMSPFSKMAFMKNKIWFKEVKKWIGLKEYLMSAFTGQEVIDYSTASATGLFNIHEKKWDEEILDFLEIEKEKLAELVDTDAYYVIKKELADELFISQDILVYIGACDGCLASYASYLGNGTMNTLTIGTSGAVRKLTKKIELDKEGKTFCYYLNKEYWVVGGASNNGGQVLEWASDVFCQNQSIYEELDQIFKLSPIGSNGVLFLPYIAGERAPLWNAKATGGFKKISIHNKREDLLRSLSEGILFNLRYISELINLDTREISVSGGFFDSPILATLAADIFGKNCIQSVFSEPSFGLICLIEPPKKSIILDQKRIFTSLENHLKYKNIYNMFVEELKTEL